MNIIIVVFLCLFFYGVLVSQWAPAGIALFTAAFAAWADKRLDKHQREWSKDPKNAQEMLSSMDRLVQQECECSCCYADPRFPNQTLKSDYEL